MSDTMVRVLAKEVGLRGLACTTTSLVQEIARRHAAYPIAAAALGYGLTAGALLGGLLKVQERVALKVEGTGPLRKLVVEADAYGRVRGYVAVPDALSPLVVDRAAVSAAIGSQGEFTVVKDLRVQNLYRSVVALQSGELDRELTHYLNTSEQVPSLAQMGVQMDGGSLVAAGGLLLQTLPGHSSDALAKLAANLAALPPMDDLVSVIPDPKEILARVLAGIKYDILEISPLEFRCSCGRDRSRQALKMLELEDRLALIADGKATVDCHFCGARYQFDQQELEAFLLK